MIPAARQADADREAIAAEAQRRKEAGALAYATSMRVRGELAEADRMTLDRREEFCRVAAAHEMGTGGASEVDEAERALLAAESLLRRKRGAMEHLTATAPPLR